LCRNERATAQDGRHSEHARSLTSRRYFSTSFFTYTHAFTRFPPSTRCPIFVVALEKFVLVKRWDAVVETGIPSHLPRIIGSEVFTAEICV
jgi:hypothetical protein